MKVNRVFSTRSKRSMEAPVGAKGQALTEYLILLCLVAVSAIAVVSVVGQNLRARYATISSALRGDKEVKKELDSPEAASYQLRGFDDYTESAGRPAGKSQ